MLLYPQLLLFSLLLWLGHRLSYPGTWVEGIIPRWWHYIGSVVEIGGGRAFIQDAGHYSVSRLYP